MRERARQSLYWPRMDSDIEAAALTCVPCNQHLPSLPKETMIARQRPSRAFEEAHADLFTFAGEQYLVYVDAYSGWPSITRLGRSATSSDLIKAFRLRFCEKSVPTKLFTDGGPQFTSESFRKFLHLWKVEHVTSSPHYAQSNGLAEAAVKQMKKIVRGSPRLHKVDWDGVARGLLVYCNTPRYDGLSPAELLFGHPIRDLVPAHRSAFEPQWQQSADKLERAQAIREKTVERYNSSSKDLLPLRIGDKVVLQDPATRRWERCGDVVERTRDRQYLVRMCGGRVLKRNRRYLRKRGVVLPPEIASKTTSPTNGEKSPAPVQVPEERPSRPRRMTSKPHRIIVDPSNVYYA